MPKRIIIEIDEKLIRVGEATTAPRSVRVGHFATIAFPEKSTLVESISEIKSQMAKAGIGRGDVDFIVNRRAVEMREISVPPVPDNELSELLKFTAKNEFASVTENWKLDYVPFSDDETKQRTVFATALNPVVYDEIAKLAEELSLKVRRILLRPFCLAESIAKELRPSESVLAVQRLDNSLELLLIQGKMLRANRSVLLSAHSPSEVTQEIVSEISRTILMASKTLEGKTVDRVLLIGATDQWSSANASLKEKFETKIIKLSESHPTAVSISGTKSTVDINEFAGVIGAAATLVERGVPGVDFANPKRRVVKELNVRKVAFWGGLAALVVVTLGVIGWTMLSTSDAKIASMEKNLQDLKKMTEPGGNQPSALQKIGEVELVDKWYANKINWLAELNEISSRLETADDVILTTLNARTGDNAATFSIAGRVSSKDAKVGLETKLQLRPYTVNPGKLDFDTTVPGYKNTFEESFVLYVNPIDKRTEVQNLARELKQRSLQESTSTKTTEQQPSGKN